MGAYKEVSKMFNDIKKVAERLGYSQSNIEILNGDIESLRKKFPQVYSNLISCVHHRDNRTPIEYGQDLVASWILEDYLLCRLQSYGLTVKLAGADKNREILPNVKTSSSSDFEISYGGVSASLEIMCDYTGYWTHKNQIDLRDAKYNKLKSTRSLFLGVSTKDNQFILLNFKNDLKVKYIPSHRPYGGKPAYTVSIEENDLVDFCMETLINKIKKELGLA